MQDVHFGTQRQISINKCGMTSERGGGRGKTGLTGKLVVCVQCSKKGVCGGGVHVRVRVHTYGLRYMQLLP